MSDEPAVGLAKSLEEAGFTMGRLKQVRWSVCMSGMMSVVVWTGTNMTYKLRLDNAKKG